MAGQKQQKQYRYKSDDGSSAAILIGVLLIAVLLVGGGLVYVILQKKGVEPVAPPAQPQANNTTRPNLTNQTPVVPPCDAACLYQRAVFSGSAAMCANLSGQYVQQCYEALANSSLEACTAVADSAKRDACIFAFALSSSNISLCDLSGERAACRRAVDPCADSADKPLCNALGKSDPSLCLSDTWCLLNYSTAAGNSSACGLIQNPVISKACVSAIRRTDKCTDLALEAERDYCYQLYATYTGDYLVCTSISPDSLYSLDCFSLFAAREANLSICDKDGLNLNNLWDCYTNYSLLTGDLAGCRKIDPLATTHKFKCAFEYAKKFGNPAACQVIDETLKQRSTCYEGAIIYSNRNLNWTWCAQVVNFDWHNKCYTEAAKLYNDSSLCDYASEQYARTSCRDAYAANKTK